MLYHVRDVCSLSSQTPDSGLVVVPEDFLQLCQSETSIPFGQTITLLHNKGTFIDPINLLTIWLDIRRLACSLIRYMVGRK